MDERRKYKRVHTDEVKIYRIGNEEEQSIGTIASVDISISGLQIILDNKLPIDTQLNILLAILPNKSPIAVSGKVIWADDAEESGQFKIGVEFIDFSDEVKKRIIEDFINHPD